MNPPIRLQALDPSPYKELVQQLAYQWIAADRPAAGRTYADYVTTLRTLLLTTQSPERTLTIVGAVLRQAVELDRRVGRTGAKIRGDASGGRPGRFSLTRTRAGGPGE